MHGSIALVLLVPLGAALLEDFLLVLPVILKTLDRPVADRFRW